MQFIMLSSIFLALSVCGASAAPAYSQSEDCETSSAPSTAATPITFATTIFLNAPSATASPVPVDQNNNGNAFRTTIFLNKPSATASASSVDQSSSGNATPATRSTIFLNGPFATATPLSSILQFNRRQIASASTDPITVRFSFGGIVPTSSAEAYGPVQTSANLSSLPASSAVATGTGLVAPIASALSVLQSTNALSSASAPVTSNASSVSVSTLVVIGTVTVTEPAVTVTVTANCSANATSVAAATGIPSAGAATSKLPASASSQPSLTASATSPAATVAPTSFSARTTIFLTARPSSSSSVVSSA